MNPSLSIVIPFYNVEQYLNECLDALLETEGIDQTEIILIDDGATDKSSQIADKYSEEHSNITVFHKENEGPSASRNKGLHEAHGDYVFYCDADDMVVPEFFAKIIAHTKTSSDDIILWDAELKYETVNLLMPKDRGYFAHEGLEKIETTYTGKELLETQLRKTGDFVATVWLAAYRRQFLIDNKLYFEKGLIHEDELLLPKIYIAAKSVHYLPEKVYIYRIREGSIMNPGTSDRKRSVDSLMHIYPSLYDYYDEVLAGEPLLELIEGNLTKRYVRMIYKYRVWRYGYSSQIDKKRLMRTARKLSHKILVLGLNLFVR
ncbi:MAG: glycosyltransferase [Clostridiales bacterium]|nr:glycosyltransferase [Clostridiales bacterium]